MPSEKSKVSVGLVRFSSMVVDGGPTLTRQGPPRVRVPVAQFDLAIEHYDKALDVDSDFNWAQFFKGITYEQMNLLQESSETIIEARRRSGQEEIAEALARGYEDSGHPGFLNAWLEVWQENKFGQRAQPTSVAMLHAGLGNIDKAFEWLERGYEERTRYMVYLQVEPQFDPLRSDPRFRDLVRRMNFPE